MATDLGKVGMRMRGDWSSSTAYEVLDAVSYNNGLYIAKQAVPANTTPTNTTYWQNAINGATGSSLEFTSTAVFSDLSSAVNAALNNFKIPQVIALTATNRKYAFYLETITGNTITFYMYIDSGSLQKRILKVTTTGTTVTNSNYSTSPTTDTDKTSDYSKFWLIW